MPFALYGLDDGCCIVLCLEFALEMDIQRTAVLDIRHGIALVVVVSADIYHQSLDCSYRLLPHARCCSGHRKPFLQPPVPSYNNGDL